ncbi:ABC-type nitrate/sulfonate/bicarbonate transport system permease component [Edaphobacter lichenicola]|uniref:ABC-type nitrate/sulfonate/bicarbonate transport system permease component n=1 Tax=Tunturiibacter gelidiferens TaxID=3069689 RepID=A0A9X0QHT5_9BACT|nr:ABC-type nitrate/sulfonate/bicarbonate transport system permease component [Edaphobacter lichenicola]
MGMAQSRAAEFVHRRAMTVLRTHQWETASRWTAVNRQLGPKPSRTFAVLLAMDCAARHSSYS